MKREVQQATLEIALVFASRGIAVFPVHSFDGSNCTCGNGNCSSAAKHPVTRNGVKDASKDPDAIRKMWPSGFSANVALATGEASGLWVLDTDRHSEDADGEISLAKLCQVHGPLPPTLTCNTGGGGVHRIFAYPTDQKIGNRAKLAPGIDVRGDGGYVVTAGSTHRSGRVYEFVDPEVPIAEAPKWLVDFVTSKGPRSSDKGAHEPKYNETSSEGSRNSTLASIAGRLRATGANEQAIFEYLLNYNRQHCQPPLEDAEVAAIARSISRYPVYDMTDVGNGRRFRDQHQDSLKYCHLYRSWYRYDGKRWRVDDDGEVIRCAKETAGRIFAEAQSLSGNDPEKARELAKFAMRSLHRQRIEAMLKMAESELPLPIRPEQFDQDDDLLNLNNGTLNTRTFQLMPHDRSNFITKLAVVDYQPGATCPTWLNFLDRIYGADAELIAFVQRAIGYSLTGDTGEQVLFFLHGTGANGKSTLLETLIQLLGDYAGSTEFRTLLARENSDAVRNDVAALVGLRLVTAVEVSRGRRLDESMVKQLTGGDTISARKLYSEFFAFKPRFKLYFSANVRPDIRGTDEGIWRRVLLIPHDIFIPPEERDRDLMKKLRTELPGILNWALEGLKAWRAHGLRPPERVVAAVAEYRADMDRLADFVSSTCHVGTGLYVPTGDLYTAYKSWAYDNGEEAQSKRTFSIMLSEKGFGDDVRTVAGRKQRVKTGLALAHGAVM